MLNPGAGRRADDDATARIESACAQAGRSLDLQVIGPDDDLAASARAAVARATADDGIVVAAGGDGTLNAVAQATLDSERPFGILPRGTFNYFGRAHGIPADLDAALEVLLTASPQPVPVGLVGPHLFLVNASIGLHPQWLEDREALAATVGRGRWIAAGAAFATLLRGVKNLPLRVERGDEVLELATPTVFITHNVVQRARLGFATEDVDGQLAALVLKPVGRWQLLALALRSALGRLAAAERVLDFDCRRLTVNRVSRFGHARVKLALDGEVLRASLPLEFRVAPRPLWLIHAPEAAPLP